MQKFAELIEQGAAQVKIAVVELRDMKNMRSITEALVKINSIENQADDVFDFSIEKLFATGVAILLLSHFFIHVGINIGLLPVTGTTIPFLSYGGSHLVTEYVAVGMVLAMRKYTSIKSEMRDDLFTSS